MAKKKQKQKNGTKRNTESASARDAAKAEPLEQSEIATWLDTFCRLAGEVGEEDEGVSHLVVPEDYRESADRLLPLIARREREQGLAEGVGLSAAQLIRRLEEAGVTGLTEAAMASTVLGPEVQFAILDELGSVTVDEGLSASSEGLRQVGHLLQDLAEQLPGHPEPFHVERFWELVPGHRATLLRLLHERTGEQTIPFLEQLGGRERAIDLQLVELAGTVASEAAAAMLVALQEKTGDKQVQKSVNKMLYSLRSKGVEGARQEPQPVADPVSPLHYEETVETRAFISGIDWQGQRLVLLAGLPGTRGFAVAQALVDDVRGVRDFTVWKMSRADLREMVDRAQQRSALMLCEVPAAHAWFILEEAFQSVRSGGFDPPREFLHWRSSESWPKPDHTAYAHPVRELVPREAGEASEPGGADWSRLMATDPLAGWTLGPDEAVKAWREVQEEGESAIIIPGAVQEERHQQAFRKAVAARFGEEARGRYIRRLEETAYLLHLSGKAGEAVLALLAADRLEEMANRIWDHPLIAALVQRDLDLVTRREQEAKEKDVSLVQSPWQGDAGSRQG